MSIPLSNDTKTTDKPLRPQKSGVQYKGYRKRVETILESFTDGFFEVDGQWTVTYWNGTAEELLLKPKEDIIGRNIWECYPEAIELKFYTEYHRCMGEQVSIRFEEYFAPMQMWFEVSVFPNGQGLSIYFKDITGRKANAEQLERERQKYRDLFDHNPMPQWVFDIDSLAFLDVNESAVAHYGYSRDEFLSMTIKQIRPLDDIPLLEAALLGLKDHKVNQTSLVRHTKKNGEIIHVEVKGTNIRFNGHQARLVVVVDKTAEISARLQKEQTIAKLREFSWMQAHEVSKPLSNLLALASLLETENSSRKDPILITKLLSQANELDQTLIKTMTKLSQDTVESDRTTHY